LPEPGPRRGPPLRRRRGPPDHRRDGASVPLRHRRRAGHLPGRAEQRRRGRRAYRLRDGVAGQTCGSTYLDRPSDGAMTDERWEDEDAGPVVRPYALIRGRTRSSGDRFDLIAMVMATGERPPSDFVLGPEHERILRMARRAVSVADLASDLDLPLGVVRVLLGDLYDHGLISVR